MTSQYHTDSLDPSLLPLRQIAQATVDHLVSPWLRSWFIGPSAHRS